MPDRKWSGILFFNELWLVQQALWAYGYKIANALSSILSTHWLALFCHLFLPQFPSALKTGKEMLSSPENTTKAKNNKKGYWYWFWNDNSYGFASSSLTQPTFLVFQIQAWIAWAIPVCSLTRKRLPHHIPFLLHMKSKVHFIILLPMRIGFLRSLEYQKNNKDEQNAHKQKEVKNFWMLVIHLMHSGPVKLGSRKLFHNIRTWRFQALKESNYARSRNSW